MNSLRDAVESLPSGNCGAMDQIRLMLGIPVADFEVLLGLLDKSNYSRVEFGVLNTVIELSKASEGQLEVNVRIATAQGEGSLRFLFKARRWSSANDVNGKCAP